MNKEDLKEFFNSVHRHISDNIESGKFTVESDAFGRIPSHYVNAYVKDIKIQITLNKGWYQIIEDGDEAEVVNSKEFKLSDNILCIVSEMIETVKKQNKDKYSKINIKALMGYIEEQEQALKESKEELEALLEYAPIDWDK